MSDQEKIEELRAKRAEIEARRESAAKAETEAAELALETKNLADAEALEKAELEHGRANISIVTTPEGMIIVKRPKAATYRKFQDAGKTDSESFEKLVAPCLVHPEKLEYRRLLDVYPHMLISCANAVVRLAGAGSSEKG